MRRKLLALIMAVSVLAIACGGDGDDEGSANGNGNGAEEGGGEEGGGAGVEVTARDFAFVPTSIEAQAGDSLEITLVNSGQVEHSFTVDDADFEIEAEAGEEASGTLTVPEDAESLEYYCKYHPDQMTGQLAVGGTAAGGGSDTGSKSYSGGSNPYRDY